MMIGDKLRAIREEKKLSQGEVEKRTGILRAHLSAIENGRLVPVIETLEKLARALEVPLYQLFYDGDEVVKAPAVFERESSDDDLWGSSGKDAKYLGRLRRLLGKATEEDRKLILFTLRKMAR